MVGDKDELLLEMESMLREQIEQHPMELRPRLRMAKVHAELGRTETFIEDAKGILLLVQNDPQHPARRHLAELAEGLDVALPSVSSSDKTPGGPRRRLGEDPKSRAYFEQLDEQYQPVRRNPAFIQQHDRRLIRNFGRPSPLMHLRRLSKELGGAQIAVKREDLLGQSTRQVMTVAGQVLLAATLGYPTVVTGAASLRTGVIMAEVAARYGLHAVVYVNDQQARQNSSLMLKIRCLGGKIVTSKRRDSTRDEAIDYCIEQSKSRFIVMGVEGAPAPFSQLNQTLVSSLGREVLAQAKASFKTVPDLLVCRGKDTADAVGFFDPFLEQDGVRMVCVDSLDSLEAPGMETQDAYSAAKHIQLTDAQLAQAEAILQGSEFPAVRREHGRYKDSKRVEYTSGSIADARRVIKQMAELEGLIVPIRTAYPMGWAVRHAKTMKPDQLVVVNMIEQHDKDLRDVAEAIGVTDH